jgi:hypothetical protein
VLILICTHINPSKLVVKTAILTASLAILPGAEGFEAYDCSNFSNPRRCTYSQIQNHAWMWHWIMRWRGPCIGKSVQMKRERLVQITRCHMDELVLCSTTTGMPTKEQKTRVIRYR